MAGIGYYTGAYGYGSNNNDKRIVNGVVYTNNNYGLDRKTSPSWYVNEKQTAQLQAANNAWSAYGKSQSYIQQMIDAAKNAQTQQGQNSATVNGSISNVQDYAKQMAGVANKVGSSAAQVGEYAGKVSNVADSLTPYAQAMKDYASSVYGQGSTLVGQGNQLLGEWSKFAPLIDKYTKSLGNISPDRYVAMAAADVQSAYQNAQGQNQRALSRMGVDPSSGAYQAQKAQWDQALATALAGAKTRARQQGLTDQVTQLAQGLGVGQNIVSAGAQIGTQGAGLMTQAGGLLGDASNVVGAMGTLYSQAGQLAGQAGGLYGQQADIYQGAGSLEQAAGQLAIALNSSAMDASKMLQDAYDSGAQFYASQAAGFAETAGNWLFL